jgi:hypothetical protein
MGGLKLEFNGDTVFINKTNNVYLINNIKQWIYLTKFYKAYLIITHPRSIKKSEVKYFKEEHDFLAKQIS